ncbi:MAG: DJ-1/PfpI family protein [Solirubrobacterales bacterium]
MKFACVIYEEMTSLDLIGPLEVFGNVVGAEFVYASPSAGQVSAERTGLTLGPAMKFDDVTQADVLLVPGGTGSRQLTRNEPLLEWIREIDRTTTWTTSVCTGALLLAAAGLLDGRRATTHWAEIEHLAELGALPVRERVVRDGKFVTAAGVSAGIDMGLTLVGDMFGETLAQAIQLGIEYDPEPPFDTGSPERAPTGMVDSVRAAATAND